MERSWRIVEINEVMAVEKVEKRKKERNERSENTITNDLCGKMPQVVSSLSHLTRLLFLFCSLLSSLKGRNSHYTEDKSSEPAIFTSLSLNYELISFTVCCPKNVSKFKDKRSYEK
ncbi:hypothetical protein QQG55_44705 [Brugia pahangi]